MKVCIFSFVFKDHFLYICKGVSHLLCLGTSPLLLQTCTKVLLLQLFVIPKKYVQKSWKPICMPNSPDDVYDGYYDLQLYMSRDSDWIWIFLLHTFHTVGTLRILSSNKEQICFSKSYGKVSSQKFACFFPSKYLSNFNYQMGLTVSVWVSKNCLHLLLMRCTQRIFLWYSSTMNSDFSLQVMESN